MSPKRPPVPLTPLRRQEWSPNDTQSLERRIDLAHETEWRHDTVDQIKAIAKTLGEVRDLARTNESTLEAKASRTELEHLTGEVKLLTERVGTLKHVTWGVLVVVAIAAIAQKKGLL